MLEYRRPPPAPGAHWWGPRSYALYLRRGEDWTPMLAVGEEQPLGRVRVRLFTCATSFYVQLTLREPRPWPLQLEDADRPETLPDEFLRVGVRFSDGRVATNLPGGFWTAPDDGPLFLSGHQYGDLADELPEDRRTIYAVRWHVWPIPPPGPLTVACAWPAHGIPESSIELDGDAVRVAAERSAAQAVPREPEPLPWWAERSESDEPIAWSVTAWLRPGDPEPSREGCDPIAGRIAREAGAESWDADTFQPWVAAYEEARDAATGDEFGWFSPAAGAYALRFTVVAATVAAARGQVERRLALPARWGVSIEVQPSGSSAPPRDPR
jgi:hypothetical protein